MRKGGFTLIELMIVIAIIAIIAAIAIPNLISGKMSANENAAAGGMKLLAVTEASWYQQDPDGNGKKDFWTYDISCLHRMYRADGTTKVSFIAIDFARADIALAALAGGATLFTIPTIEVWTGVTTDAKSGYEFQVLSLDAVAGSTYKVNTVGSIASPPAACHSSKFGFMSAPQTYATSGVNSFIVNQEGTVYANDTGGQANRWVTTAAGGLNWPSANPAGTAGPGGRNWRVAD